MVFVTILIKKNHTFLLIISKIFLDIKKADKKPPFIEYYLFCFVKTSFW